MPLPEGYLPRKGDELLIRVRARRDTDKLDDPIMGAFEVVGREHNVFYLPIDQIHSLYCRAWNVGEKVLYKHFNGPAEVIATYGNQAWIKNLDNNKGKYTVQTWTADANDLKPWIETDVVETVTEQKPDWMRGAPCGGAIGSQSIVGDDDPIANRDASANR